MTIEADGSKDGARPALVEAPVQIISIPLEDRRPLLTTTRGLDGSNLIGRQLESPPDLDGASEAQQALGDLIADHSPSAYSSHITGLPRRG